MRTQYLSPLILSLLLAGCSFRLEAPSLNGNGGAGDGSIQPKVCVVTGCSAHVCADEDVMTTCEFRPEYACFAHAVCEVQDDGECGWTETDAFLSCLDDIEEVAEQEEHMETAQDRCALIPDPGLCRALIPRYYFDQTAGACAEFVWGGCGGVVPFDTLEECAQACES